ncbi:3-oxoacyl-ACP synthase [Lentimicrobium sp. S6]|uniref:3-oxoacyl-ACP synthase n=1 Tax=Lentimicrobium sp. S6 TaxID=2735872 RepID=UPI001556597B|nr:3-oxoacyl-ACP synthase [Lentimicrobium sp. S6]NPD44573.1 3-oxoacyl-ACP synthase [Lentimicrobium sp. S6]
MNTTNNIGILGTGIYLPENKMTAKEIADATQGTWTEEAIIEKLGIIEKPIPGENDGTQEMGVWATFDALKNTGVDPLDIDLIISIGEEWKEYPLTTTAIYIQEKIGAEKAWAFDLQQRCCSTVSAMKVAKDMMNSDPDINTVLIAGGYRNGDFVDYTDTSLSMMFNLGAGGGAIILHKGMNKNLLHSSHIITDGSLARDVGVLYGGTCHPITKENVDKAYQSLQVFDVEHMKTRLNEVSMKNWLECIEKAFMKSGIEQNQLDYLAVLHFKRSMHSYILDELGLKEKDSIYLENYGHLGQIDQILSLHLALQSGQVKEGSIISMISAGIGYAWAANVISWGKIT